MARPWTRYGTRSHTRHDATGSSSRYCHHSVSTRTASTCSAASPGGLGVVHLRPQTAAVPVQQRRLTVASGGPPPVNAGTLLTVFTRTSGRRTGGRRVVAALPRPRVHVHWFRWSGDDPFSGSSLYTCRCGVVRPSL